MLKLVWSSTLRVLPVGVFALLAASCISTGGRTSLSSVTVLSVSLPARPVDASGGRAVLERVQSKGLAERERVITEEILRGNVPSTMRTLVPVRIVVDMAEQRHLPGTAWVLPDYLSVGSDVDYVRVPLSLPAAQRIAAALGLSLPTVPIVNAIYEQARVRLSPQSLPPSAQMTSIAYVLRHEQLLTEQLASQNSLASGNLLIAGHKKDVVLTRAGEGAPRRVAIFGWHRDVNKPIQPLSTVHGENYVDYSHGIRFIAPWVRVETSPPVAVSISSDQIQIAPAPLDAKELAIVSGDPS